MDGAVPELTPHQREIMEFAQALTHDVDMVAVLRGHLYLERAIFALLCKSEPGREAHFASMSFMQKVNLFYRRVLFQTRRSQAFVPSIGSVTNSLTNWSALH